MPVISHSVVTDEVNPADDPAAKRFYQDTQRGYYWYEKEPEKPIEDKNQETRIAKDPPRRRVPSLKNYDTAVLWEMHPDDFQALLMDFQKKAVMKPTEENIGEYMTMQDIARRKALAYTNVYTLYTQKHPEYTTQDTFHTTVPGRNILGSMKIWEVEGTLTKSRDDFALVAFLSATCPQCQVQKEIFGHFTKKYQWEIREIDTERAPKLAARFNVERVPMTILVYNKTGEHIPVSNGILALDSIEENIYRGIRILKGETTPENYSIYDFQKGGGVDTNRYQNQRKKTKP